MIFWTSHLGLHLHPSKKHLNRADTGIDFTGFIIKPGRIYLRHTSLSGCKRKIRPGNARARRLDPETLTNLSQSLNSYLGMLQAGQGIQGQEVLCQRVESLFLLADDDCTKTTPSS